MASHFPDRDPYKPCIKRVTEPGTCLLLPASGSSHVTGGGLVNCHLGRFGLSGDGLWHRFRPDCFSRCAANRRKPPGCPSREVSLLGSGEPPKGGGRHGFPSTHWSLSRMRPVGISISDSPKKPLGSPSAEGCSVARQLRVLGGDRPDCNGLWSTVITPTGVAGASLGMLAERAGPRLIWAITRFPHARCQLRPVVHRPSRFSLQIDAHSLLFMLVRELPLPAGFEPAHPAPEAGALSPELREPEGDDSIDGSASTLRLVKYVSTKGEAPMLDFRGVLVAGLASDGGLYVPEEVPRCQKSGWTGHINRRSRPL